MASRATVSSIMLSFLPKHTGHLFPAVDILSCFCGFGGQCCRVVLCSIGLKNIGFSSMILVRHDTR